MRYTPEGLLAALLDATPRRTAEAPQDARGLYGLVDHFGDLRYIGSTSSAAETLHKRIHQRHRTGSENTSHYFSRMYNTGRMWRDRDDPTTKADGDIAKALRNAFVADHCQAVWLPLPDTVDIARLEAEVIAIAPSRAVAWNRRGMEVYAEPADLVDVTIRRIGFGPLELAALERQRQRCSGGAAVILGPAPPLRQVPVKPFPRGPFRFVALDVETANNQRGSICQIGVACVRLNNTIETWMTYVDPQTSVWTCSWLHGITAQTVSGAPTFAEVLPVLDGALEGCFVYQHSGFDRSAIAAACATYGLAVPPWQWRDSVQVARAAWPELKGNGGHGLANLKRHLDLRFEHHDAEEDARAAAEIVLRAEGTGPTRTIIRPTSSQTRVTSAGDVDLLEDFDAVDEGRSAPHPAPVLQAPPSPNGPRLIGTSSITQGNIDNAHIYLRTFFDRFPQDAVGGSNRSEVARREVAVHWGGEEAVRTDLDGTKKLFRKRGWIRTFFERTSAVAGDQVMVEETAPYTYRISLLRSA